jgi:hypothetical protein
VSPWRFMGHWKLGAGLLFLGLLVLLGTRQLVESLSQEPVVALEMGGTYENLRKHSSVAFSPLIRGHSWFGIPKTDARLRFIDPQYEFMTPRARFFTVGFNKNVITSIRMSPQIEPLLFDDALKVALDLQNQWHRGGWRVAGPKSYPPFTDTFEWRSRFRSLGHRGTTYWNAGEKYQVAMFMNRFTDSKRPNEERYLITLSIGKPWTPFDDE